MKFNKKQSPEQIRRANEIRRSGAAGTHQDRRFRRKRTRRAKLDEAIEREEE